MGRDYQSTIQMLNFNLERARERIEEQQVEFTYEKAKAAQRDVTPLFSTSVIEGVIY